MRYLVIALLALGCATDQLEVTPDLDPGNSVGVDIKSCFSDEAVATKWALGIPALWNALNGCKGEDDGEETREEEADQEGVLVT